MPSDVIAPKNLDKNFKETILQLKFDILLVAAYGKILPEWLLTTPSKDSINIHYSLLPKYRGASPIQSALLNGEKITGISIMRMTAGLDEGPVFVFHRRGAQRACITKHELESGQRSLLPDRAIGSFFADAPVKHCWEQCR